MLKKEHIRNGHTSCIGSGSNKHNGSGNVQEKSSKKKVDQHEYDEVITVKWTCWQ
jgi:hypothetical protein